MNVPCLGTVIPKFFLKDGTYQQDGEMLCGVAVYHPNLVDGSPLLRNLQKYNAAYAKAKQPPRAFDSYLANEILPRSGETALIQHMGRSSNFRREDGKLICSYAAESRWSPIVAPETMLVHGVKDESLIDLLRAEMNLPRGAVTTAAPVREFRAAPARTAPASGWGDTATLPAERIDPVNHYSGEVSVIGIAQNIKNGHTTFPPGMGDTIRPRQLSPADAATAITAAKAGVSHWPECKSVALSLHEAKNGSFRVGCQCGALSPKLAPGIDWPHAWDSQAALDTPSASVKESQEQGGQDGLSRLAHNQEIASSNLAPATNQPGGSGANPDEFAGSRGVTVASAATPGAPEKPAFLKVTQVRLGSNGGSVIFEDGSSQLLTKGQIVKARGRVAKKQRTAAEQAKIDLRMAALRARKPQPKRRVLAKA